MILRQCGDKSLSVESREAVSHMGNSKGETVGRGRHAQGILENRELPPSSQSSSIDRDRVDRQLYPGTFTYLGPGCGFWTRGQATDTVALYRCRPTGESYGPFFWLPPHCLPIISRIYRLFEAWPTSDETSQRGCLIRREAQGMSIHLLHRGGGSGGGNINVHCVPCSWDATTNLSAPVSCMGRRPMGGQLSCRSGVVKTGRCAHMC